MLQRVSCCGLLARSQPRLQAAWSRAAASCTRESACCHEKAKPRQRREGHLRRGLLRLDLGLARGWLRHEQRLPAHKSASARMLMKTKTKEEEGKTGRTRRSLVAQSRSCLSAACSRAAVPCTRARVRAPREKQVKRREEEGTHVAVSCLLVLVCWHHPCGMHRILPRDTTDKNQNV